MSFFKCLYKEVCRLQYVFNFLFLGTSLLKFLYWLISALGNLVLQQGSFWHKYCCFNYCHVGYVHSQRLHRFTIASNINNQVYRHLDHLWHGSSFCHHHPHYTHRASPSKIKPCFRWKFPKSRNANAKNKTCCTSVGTKCFTHSWNCFYLILLNMCLDNIYLLKQDLGRKCSFWKAFRPKIKISLLFGG